MRVTDTAWRLTGLVLSVCAASIGLAAATLCAAAPSAQGKRPNVIVFLSDQQRWDTVGRAIRTKQWKYSVRAPERDGWRDSGSDVYVEEFLYDLEKDPHERANLVGDPSLAAVRARLAERLRHLV